MSLSVSEEHAGKSARCPGCGNRVTVPSLEPPAAAGSGAAKEPAGSGNRSADGRGDTKHRTGWQESDPANPNLWMLLGLGIAINCAVLLLGLLLR